MKENLKYILDSMDLQSCMPIKGIEIIKYLYPLSILCSNSRCPKNKAIYFDLNDDQHKEKSTFGVKEECFICRKFKFEFPENIKHHINGINSLTEILENRKISNYNKMPLSFLTIDLRKDKKDGILSKSHLVDSTIFNDKTSYDMINDFIEFKETFHFSFFISSIEHSLNDNKHLNSPNEKFLTQPDEAFGKFL